MTGLSISCFNHPLRLSHRVHGESLFFAGRETTPGEKHLAAWRQWRGKLYTGYMRVSI
jgi:hypothetical protein